MAEEEFDVDRTDTFEGQTASEGDSLEIKTYIKVLKTWNYRYKADLSLRGDGQLEKDKKYLLRRSFTDKEGKKWFQVDHAKELVYVYNDPRAVILMADTSYFKKPPPPPPPPEPSYIQKLINNKLVRICGGAIILVIIIIYVFVKSGGGERKKLSER